MDISCDGVCFFSPVLLQKNKKYTLILSEKDNSKDSFTIQPIRVKEIPKNNPMIYEISGRFSREIELPDLKSIMADSFNLN